ncbi:Transposable element Tcb2 transposase [Dictyocoela muelleri]|nr:Transposable element Tcb2 transposase [Dictyocoela muelleri]
MNLENFTFQQDNDPKHTSKIAKDYFIKNNISLSLWAPQFPDLNLIETLWGIIKSKLAEFKAPNFKELNDKIVEVWSSIELKTYEMLEFSFRKRATAVYNVIGKH